MHLSIAPLTRSSDTLKTEKQFCKNFSNFIDSLEQPTSQNLKKLNFYQNSPNKKKSLDLGFEFFPVLCVECCTVVQTCTLYTFKPYVVFGKQHNRFYSIHGQHGPKTKIWWELSTMFLNFGDAIEQHLMLVKKIAKGLTPCAMEDS